MSNENDFTWKQPGERHEFIQASEGTIKKL